MLRDDFTNRSKHIDAYLDLVHGTESAGTNTRFFVGEAGVGKTCLVDFLRRDVSYKRDWNFDRAQPASNRDQALRRPEPTSIARGLTTPIPTAVVDFAAPWARRSAPCDQLASLAAIQRQLGSHGIRLPHFTYAHILYLVRSGEERADVWNKGLPHDEFNLIQQLLSTAAGESYPGAGLVRGLLKSAEKLLGGKLGKKLAEHGLEKDRVVRLNATDPQKPHLILEGLPETFATDLKTALRDSPVQRQVVLFFDSLERLESSNGVSSLRDYFQDSRWVTELTRQLLRADGVLLVFAGQHTLGWRDDFIAFPQGSIEFVELKGLADADARAYLDLRGIDRARHDQILASGMPDRDGHFLPLVLARVADMAFTEHASVPAVAVAPDPAQTRNILATILSDQDEEQRTAVCALAACESFDLDLYMKLGEWLRFQASNARFQQLTRLPFFKATENDPHCYSVTDFLPQLLQRAGSEVFNAAHRRLFEWYDGRTEQDEDARILRIRHLQVIDPERALMEYKRLEAELADQEQQQRDAGRSARKDDNA